MFENPVSISDSQCRIPDRLPPHWPPSQKPTAVPKLLVPLSHAGPRKSIPWARVVPVPSNLYTRGHQPMGPHAVKPYKYQPEIKIFCDHGFTLCRTRNRSAQWASCKAFANVLELSIVLRILAGPRELRLRGPKSNRTWPSSVSARLTYAGASDLGLSSAHQ